MTSPQSDATAAPSSSTPVAVVTGAARGIGLAITNWFLAQGHRVIMLDIDQETLATAARDLGDEARGLALQCDVSQPDQVQACIDRGAARFGRIDY